ncbi:MAG: alanine racemase [Oscillospiraceae bacterium]|nr:alanine racemase [Oscillospiraceae bacterium]
MKEILVSRAALKNNLGAVRARAPGLTLIGSLRSDAYGLGLIPAARFLYDEGVRFFAVESAGDAARLRAEGFSDVELLLTRSTSDPEEIETLLDLGAAATVGSQEAAVALAGIADRRGTVAEAHVRVDTGCGAYGFAPAEADSIAAVFQYMKGIAVSGLYTVYDPAASRKARHIQARAFGEVLDKLRAAKLETGLVHAAGSSVLLTDHGAKDPLPLFDAVRVGSALTGHISGRVSGRKTGLIPAARLISRVAEAGWRPAGAKPGGKRLKAAARVGIVPAGTADGLDVSVPPASRRALWAEFRRRWFSSGPVLRLADGKRLPLLGPAGPDFTAVRIDHLSVQVGDEVYADVNPIYCSGIPRRYTT